VSGRSNGNQEDYMATQQDTRVSHVRRRRYWREDDARLVVEAWRQSGLTMAEYAKLHGVHAKRLGRWAQRLQTSQPTVTFHPVQLRRDQPLKEPDSRIEVVLTNGHVIRLPAAFAAGDLRQVLDILEGRP
jgi:transposase-like protein